jgi:hypothetical protein
MGGMVKRLLPLIFVFASTFAHAVPYQDFSASTGIHDFYTPGQHLMVLPDGSIKVQATNTTATDVKIQDGNGSGIKANVSTVDGINALSVSVVNLPVNASAALNAYLLNGTSNLMNVSGTIATPVCFRYTNTSATQDSYVTSLVIVGNDVSIGPNKFYAETILANGMTYSIKNESGTTLIYTFKRNEDLMSVSSNFYLNTAPSPNMQNFWIDYAQPIKLRKTLNDYIELCVRDNLTGITYLTAMLKGFKK